jgi:hypothetical protein
MSHNWLPAPELLTIYTNLFLRKCTVRTREEQLTHWFSLRYTTWQLYECASSLHSSGKGSYSLKYKAEKLSHYTQWRHRGERRYIFYSFLTLALDGGEWSASRPGHGFSLAKDPRYPLYRRLGGPQSQSRHRD